MITDDEKLTCAFNHLVDNDVVLSAYNEDIHVQVDGKLHLVLRTNHLSEHDVSLLLSVSMLFGLTFGISSQKDNHGNTLTIILMANG